ncbi:MAG TPA: sulfatase-like hydrolase/transferase, partial [Tissierellaceae bacterium]
INETDKALRKLVDYFDKEDEPVVLVFFGDHNPWLGDENKGYKMLNIDMGLEDEESFKNYYTTPYVFWANDKAKEVIGNDFKKEGEDVSPNFLMTELFEVLNYPGDEYMQYSKDLKNNYFTVNNDMFFRQADGNYTRQLEGEDFKVWREFNSVQYYHGRHFKYDYLK